MEKCLEVIKNCNILVWVFLISHFTFLNNHLVASLFGCAFGLLLFYIAQAAVKQDWKVASFLLLTTYLFFYSVNLNWPNVLGFCFSNSIFLFTMCQKHFRDMSFSGRFFYICNFAWIFLLLLFGMAIVIVACTVLLFLTALAIAGASFCNSLTAEVTYPLLILSYLVYVFTLCCVTKVISEEQIPKEFLKTPALADG